MSFWAPHKPDHLVVKRVVGLEGDEVVMDRRRMPREAGAEGDKLRKEWELMGRWNWEGSDKQGKGGVGQGLGKRRVRVPYGHVWIEGDNWRESVDSNNYGPVRTCPSVF